MPSSATRRRLPGRRMRRTNRFLDSVSARLIIAILFSVVPMAALAGLMAWHSYRTTVEASSARAAVVAEALMAHTDDRITTTERILRAVAARPDLRDRAGCGALLQLVRALQPGELVDLALVDAAGGSACGGGGGSAVPAAPAVPDATADAACPSTPGDAVPIRRLTLLNGDGATARPILRMTLPATGPDGPGRLVADMTLGWTRAQLQDSDLWRTRMGPDGDTEAWLSDHNGNRVPLCADCGWTLTRTARSTTGRLADGRFLQREMIGAVDLLVTTRPSRAESHALSVFLWRVVGIALLLALGLLVVAIGTSLLIVSPLRAVTRSVTEWRRVGVFDPRHGRATPIELRQLSRAFAQATQSLAAHEERLQKAEGKQELLIKEIHHRVKNNLQIIASLLNLQANRIRQPEARAEFASARDRVRALATLHRHLYSEGDLHTLNMRSFLDELCGQLFQAIGEKEGRRIRLEIEAPELVMSTDQAVPLALVVTEAVSNAIKYAFPGGRSGLVSVRLTEDVAGIATMVIEDDGVGIPAGRAETETGVRDGIGIQLIRGFARQLGATLEVVEGDAGLSGAGGGTRYTLLVPLHPKVQGYEEPEPPERAEVPAAAMH